MQAQARPQVNPQQVRKSLLTWGIVIAVAIVGYQVGWRSIWREGLIRPMLNALLFLYANLGESFVVAIAVFTLVLRLITTPFTMQQIRSSRKMQALQPQIAEMQKKYGNDKERVVREQQRLYKQHGVSPLGGCLPTLIQFPIWIGLYQSINSVLADTPLELMQLGKDVYAGFTRVLEILPLESTFLGINLAEPDPTPFVLPVLVAGTMWLQQKLMTQPASDDQQASMNQTMQVMMPLMFGYFTTQFASGLAIYFVISNVVGIVIQWAAERIGRDKASSAPSGSLAKRKDRTTNGRTQTPRERG
ncbi:MAG: YidC/Oxa1 family membrane protein insertase [Chloroflexota bacterium]